MNKLTKTKQEVEKKSFWRGRNGRSFIISGVILTLIAYPFFEFIISRDYVLSLYRSTFILMFISIGLSLVIAGIIKDKLGVRKNKLNWIFKALFLAYCFGLFLIVIGRMNILLFQYLFVLLGFLSSIISFKYRTRGLGVFVFISATGFLILGIISFIGYVLG